VRQYCNFIWHYCCNFLCDVAIKHVVKATYFILPNDAQANIMRIQCIRCYYIDNWHYVMTYRDIYLGSANNWPVNGLLSVVWNPLKSRVVLHIEDCDCTAIVYRRSIPGQWRREWRRSERRLKSRIFFFTLSPLARSIIVVTWNSNIIKSKWEIHVLFYYVLSITLYFSFNKVDVIFFK